MKIDAATIDELYRAGVLSARKVRLINVVNSLQAGMAPAIVADHYRISRQAVYKIRRRLILRGVLKSYFRSR